MGGKLFFVLKTKTSSIKGANLLRQRSRFPGSAASVCSPSLPSAHLFSGSFFLPFSPETSNSLKSCIQIPFFFLPALAASGVCAYSLLFLGGHVGGRSGVLLFADVWSGRCKSEPQTHICRTLAGDCVCLCTCTVWKQERGGSGGVAFSLRTEQVDVVSTAPVSSSFRH